MAHRNALEPRTREITSCLSNVLYADLAIIIAAYGNHTFDEKIHYGLISKSRLRGSHSRMLYLRPFKHNGVRMTYFIISWPESGPVHAHKFSLIAGSKYGEIGTCAPWSDLDPGSARWNPTGDGTLLDHVRIEYRRQMNMRMARY
jgi:hypothetical protein